MNGLVADMLFETHLDLILRNEEDRPTPCEGQTHAEGKNGHTPEQHAEFWMILPCCGFDMLICRSRVENLRTRYDFFSCETCHRVMPTSTITFIELPTREA